MALVRTVAVFCGSRDGVDPAFRRAAATLGRRLAEAGIELPGQGLGTLAAATLKQYTRMVREGLGELDKSGVAELTFKGRRVGNTAKPDPSVSPPGQSQPPAAL